MQLQPVLNLLNAGGPLLGGGGGLPTLFVWNSELAKTLPVTSTFTRASVKQVLTKTTTLNWYQEIKSGEVPLDGLRRVENLIDADVINWTASAQGAAVSPVLTDNFADDPGGEATAVRSQMDPGGTGAGDRSRLRLQVTGIPGVAALSGSIWLKLNTGTSKDLLLIVLAPAASSETVTVTDSWQRFAVNFDGPDLNPTIELRVQGNLNSGTDVDLLIADGTNYGPQLEPMQSSSDAPGLFVNKDTEYLNIGVNGVQYFNTTNGNSVDGNGVVTEAAGTTITGGGYLPEPAATNQILESSDIADAAWTKTNLSAGTQNVEDIGLAGNTLDAGVAAGVAHTATAVVSSSATRTMYVIAKAGTGQFLTVRTSTTADEYAVFDLTGGTITETGAGATSRITDLGGGWYKCEVSSSVGTGTTGLIGISDTGTPGQADPTFNGANETILVHHVQFENTAFSTSPIITSGSTVTRVADSLTDVAWPAEASAVVDTTVASAIPGGNDANRQNMLGFGSGADRNFQLFASNQAAIINGGISSTITASSSYEGERHSFGMSLTINEGIVVDDEDNDNTDVTGTPSQGIIYIGSNSLLQTVPARNHQIKIFAQTLTVEELKAQLP